MEEMKTQGQRPAMMQAYPVGAKNYHKTQAKTRDTHELRRREGERAEGGMDSMLCFLQWQTEILAMANRFSVTNTERSPEQKHAMEQCSLSYVP